MVQDSTIAGYIVQDRPEAEAGSQEGGAATPPHQADRPAPHALLCRRLGRLSGNIEIQIYPSSQFYIAHYIFHIVRLTGDINTRT